MDPAIGAEMYDEDKRLPSQTEQALNEPDEVMVKIGRSIELSQAGERDEAAPAVLRNLV